MTRIPPAGGLVRARASVESVGPLSVYRERKREFAGRYRPSRCQDWGVRGTHRLRSLSLSPGRYSLAVRGGDDRFQLDPNRIVVKRGGRAIVRVTLKRAVASVAIPSPQFPVPPPPPVEAGWTPW